MILQALLVASLAGSAAAQHVSSDTFVHLTGRRWLTLDPANSFDAVSYIVTGNVYESLLASKGVDRLGELEPLLASEVPTRENGLLSGDGRTYAFPIRAAVFHDGSPLTPEDVRYSLLRFMLLDSPGGPANLLLRPILGIASTRDEKDRLRPEALAAFKAIEAGEGKVTIRLAKPDETFLKVLSALPIITSKAWAVKQGDWDGTEKGLKGFNGKLLDETPLHEKTNGTGPFRVASAGRDEIVFERHEAYWRKPAALREVHFEVVSNSGLRLFKLQAGDADAGYLEDSFRPLAKAVEGLKIDEDLPNHEVGYIFLFNHAVDPDSECLGSGKLDGQGVPPAFFADADVRRAFALSFDHDRFLRLALAGRGRKTSGLFPPLLVKGAGRAASRDLKEAEALLRKAHGGALWTAGMSLNIAYPAENLSKQIAAEVLKEGLEKLNPRFKINLYALGAGPFYAAVETRQLPIFVDGFYADYPDAHSYALGLMHSSGYFPRFQGYSSREADALIEQAQGEPDAAKRRELYLELDALSRRDAPHFFTYAPEPFRAYRTGVLGLDSTQNVNNLNFNGLPYFYAFSKKP